MARSRGLGDVYKRQLLHHKKNLQTESFNLKIKF
jgi:hypothetical protein